MSAEPDSRLVRRLGVADAVVIGLGAMLGTGVFVVFAPAAERAGWWLLLSLVIAAFVAYANATSTAQLAAVHPESGGAYAYGRHRLGPAWGAVAGYAFLVGKIASAGAAALAVGTYAWPEHRGWVAAGAAIAATLIDARGVVRTVGTTWLLVIVLIGVLTLVVVVGLVGGSSSPTAEPCTGCAVPTPGGVLSAAALLFFAFAGYARIATLGEEVRDPARTIPRAILLALGIVLVVYLAVAVSALYGLGPDRLARSRAPLRDVVVATGESSLSWVVQLGGAVAAGAVLLSLVAGIARTAFAMAAQGDLPRQLAKVHRRWSVPHVATLVTGAAVLAVIATGGLVGAVSVSAFTVLVYYAVANLASLRLGLGERRWPRWLGLAGLIGCLALAGSLPIVIVGAASAGLAGLMLTRAIRMNGTFTRTRRE
jgi:basic amino acid/polyamine antiporter, APA family